MRLKEHFDIAESAKLEGNVLKGVHILGPTSKNGRKYNMAAMKSAMPMYEGATSYVDHGERNVANKFAVIKNVTFNEATGLWGDYVMNPKHPIFEQVKWWAENAPNEIGLSHSISGNEVKNEVTKIDAVESVDLVHKPATVAGLYEGMTDEKIAVDKLIEALQVTNRGDCTKAQLCDAAKKLLEVINKGKIMELKDATLADITKDRPDLVAAIEKPAADAASALERKVQEALAKIPNDKRSETFVEQVRAVANDDKKLKAIVDDRLALLKPAKSTGKPVKGAEEEIEDTEEDTEIEEDDEKIDEDEISENVIKALGLKKKG